LSLNPQEYISTHLQAVAASPRRADLGERSGVENPEKKRSNLRPSAHTATSVFGESFRIHFGSAGGEGECSERAGESGAIFGESRATEPELVAPATARESCWERATDPLTQSPDESALDAGWSFISGAQLISRCAAHQHCSPEGGRTCQPVHNAAERAALVSL